MNAYSPLHPNLEGDNGGWVRLWRAISALRNEAQETSSPLPLCGTQEYDIIKSSENKPAAVPPSCQSFHFGLFRLDN